MNLSSGMREASRGRPRAKFGYALKQGHGSDPTGSAGNASTANPMCIREEYIVLLNAAKALAFNFVDITSGLAGSIATTLQ